MKPYDSKGEYTPAEVKAALSGTSGTRQMSYRYERLDSNNNFIEDIDYIQSCTINNDSLADIKRTAKFDILDTGTINYLSDRIKPYVRLAMPADETYDSTMRALSPDAWWKMDDATVAPAPSVSVARAADLNYATAGTADFVDLTTENARSTSVQQGSGMVRSEYWSYVNTSTPHAFQVEIKNTGSVDLTLEIYSAKSTTDVLMLARSADIPAGADYTYVYPLPATGVYLCRVVSQSTTSCPFSLTYFTSVRLEDSSGNGVYGVGSGLSLGSPSVVHDGGTSLKISGVSRSFITNDPNIYLRGGATLNYWVSGFSTGNQNQSSFGTQSGNFSYYLSDDGTPGTFTMVATFNSYATLPAYSSTVTIPAGMLTTPGAKMVTIAIDPAGKGARLFINGNIVGTFADMSAYATLFAQEFISYTYQSSYSAGTTYLDDFSIHAVALPSSMIAKLFQIGVSAVTGRSGYVEWPQGVFVLSSPKRTMVEGNYVHREVEGYDQLSVMKEDSVENRYTLGTDQFYTDGIYPLLPFMQAASTNLYDPRWAGTNGGVITSPTTGTLTATGGQTSFIGTSTGVMRSGSFSMSAKVVPATANMTIMQVNQSDNSGLYFGLVYSSGNLQVQDPDSTVSVTYSATTHAYWKIYESGGKLVAATSPNGTTWTTLYTSKHVYDIHTPLAVYFSTAMIGSSAASTISNVAIYGQSTVPTNITASSAYPATTLEWAPGTPKLTIVNDLLAAINYTSATFDEDGIFTSKPYMAPQYRTPKFQYATDSQSVITGDVNQTMDIFGIPNKWVVTVSEPDRPALTSTYVNSNPLSPTSTVSRGRTIVDFRTEQSAPDQTSLDAQVARLAFEASQVYEEIEFDTALMPIHQDFDIYTVKIDGLAVADKYAERAWSMDLSNGAVMHHKIRKVVIV